MGIPFYFREIVSKNRKILTNINKCNRLYLDFNSIIHQSSQKVINDNRVWRNPEKMEEAIFKSILQSTYDVCNSCPPDQLLYIGIDGVAPLAKMIQQRKRRHLSALQNNLINEFKVKNKIPFNSWDSNCITPGTSFMRKLNTFLKEHFNNTRLPFSVIVSGPDEEGEGEHKIIKYIKDLGKDGFTDVIYGLDADLIMLSLSCEDNDIYLMRESTQFHHRSRDIGFKYLDIKYLRKGIRDYLGESCSINDYVFICFLLGNDFLPSFIGFDIKNGGLQCILDAYNAATQHNHPQQKQTLIIKENGKYSIDLPLLTQFFKELSMVEDQNIIANITRYYETPYVEKQSNTPLERYMNEMMALPLIKRNKIIDPDQDTFWKATYYKTFLNVMVTDIKMVDDVVRNYIDGLTWNVDYYFNKVFSNSWYYRYNTSPLITDIYRYLVKTQQNPTLGDISGSNSDIMISDMEQLLIVLPYRSIHLFPPNVQQKLLDVKYGYSHLYPISFQVITFLKHQLWECIPILPPINLSKIKEINLNMKQ